MRGEAESTVGMGGLTSGGRREACGRRPKVSQGTDGKVQTAKSSSTPVTKKRKQPGATSAVDAFGFSRI